MNNSSATFLSCDWGTSAFRLRLVERQSLRVLTETHSDEGNAATYARWQQAGLPPAQRVAFYQGILGRHLANVERQAQTKLREVPVVLSGMASSTIGMLELPYKALPFATDGSDLRTETLAPTAGFELPILLISGVKTGDDVMRGEEVQLVGCQFENTAETQLFLHPGTHAKHVWVRNGRAEAMKTYMTGEFFSLLTSNGILAASVEAGGRLEEGRHREWFERGVWESQQNNLLNSAFGVRTNDLFGKADKRENYFYLSGLLIGSECRELLAHPPVRIMLAGEPVLLDLYGAALHALGIAGRCPISTKTAEEVTLHGQAAVLEKHLSTLTQ